MINGRCNYLMIYTDKVCKIRNINEFNNQIELPNKLFT